MMVVDTGGDGGAAATDSAVTSGFKVCFHAGGGDSGSSKWIVLADGGDGGED